MPRNYQCLGLGFNGKLVAGAFSGQECAWTLNDEATFHTPTGTLLREVVWPSAEFLLLDPRKYLCDDRYSPFLHRYPLDTRCEWDSGTLCAQPALHARLVVATNHAPDVPVIHRSTLSEAKNK
jgi:hypothetical protein